MRPLSDGMSCAIGPSDITFDEELPNMGRSALGVLTIGQYSPAATRQANLDFVAAWKKEFGADSIPTFFAIAGWDGMQAVFDVIKAQKGKIDPDYLKTHAKRPHAPPGRDGPRPGGGGGGGGDE